MLEALLNSVTPCLPFDIQNILPPKLITSSVALSHFTCAQLCDPWTVARQVALSMEFSRQEYWSGVPCPPPGDLPYRVIKPASLCLLHWQADSLPLSHLRSPQALRAGKSFCLVGLTTEGLGGQQAFSARCIHISPLVWISFPFRSPQRTERSSLCYIVGSH